MADSLLMWMGGVCLAGAAVGCLYLMLVCALVIRLRREEPAPQSLEARPVTVLVPLCGAEPGLASRLMRLCDQDYPAAVQILCGTRDSRDPAILAVQKVMAERPGCVIECHAEDRVHGRNLKISNLTNMMQHARHDVLVLIDSDIKVGRDYLSKVVARLNQPNVEAVTCLYYGTAQDGLWARLAAMGISFHFLPNVILALKFNLARPCFGSTIAISRHTLQRIGGFRAFAGQLWDDYAIGEAVRKLGHEVAVPHFALGHVCSDRSLKELAANQLRYARTIRAIDPAGYAGSIITHPFPLALIALGCGAGEEAVFTALIALACRLALYACVEYRFSIRSGTFWLIPFRDVISFAIYAASFFGATVVWRGQRYRVASDGTMVPSGE